MKKKYWSIALAYTGVIVGAGLSSGQDLLQYFLCFGSIGLVGVIVLGLLNVIFGKIILTLGCYYKAPSHEEVLKRISTPLTTRIIDWTLIISSFVMGFVMIAGAGANLQQQFGLPVWIGSLLCTALVILVSHLNIDKITSVLGIFTPIIIVMILICTVYTFAGKTYDFAALSASAQTIQPAIGNLWLSVLNYFALCVMTGVSMAFVLGGSLVHISIAQKGGALGGALIGMIIVAASFTLFANINLAKEAEIPMLAVVNQINPVFALFYSLTIFCLIFNTAFSLLYGCAQRLAVKHEDKKNLILIVLSIAAFILSFGGFKQLVSWMYPILGYLGIILLVVLAAAWIRERDNIEKELHLRRKMIGLQIHKIDKDKPYSKKLNKELLRLGKKSKADTKKILKETEKVAQKVISDDSLDDQIYEDELTEILPDAEIRQESSDSTSVPDYENQS